MQGIDEKDWRPPWAPLLRTSATFSYVLGALFYTVLSSFFLKFIYFFYLFLAVLGLRCCAWAFSSCSERGLLFIAVRGLLITVASLVAEQGL